MSGTRTLVELGTLVGGVVGLVVLVLWLAKSAAGTLTGFVSPEVDRTMGAQAFRIVSQARCPNPAPARYVQDITKPLLEALGPTPFAFEFTVVDDEQINAFALPGGFVTVNMGLLNAAESGEEVAAVLAHEIQHVVRRHGTERMLRELGGSTLLYALFGGTDVAAPASTLANFVSTAYDRDQEREADTGGRELLVKAGIDPRGMAHFFERLSKVGPTLPELVSTHPDPGNRAEAAARAAEGARVTRKVAAPKGLQCR